MKSCDPRLASVADENTSGRSSSSILFRFGELRFFKTDAFDFGTVFGYACLTTGTRVPNEMVPIKSSNFNVATELFRGRETILLLLRSWGIFECPGQRNYKNEMKPFFSFCLFVSSLRVPPIEF